MNQLVTMERILPVSTMSAIYATLGTSRVPGPARPQPGPPWDAMAYSSITATFSLPGIGDRLSNESAIYAYWSRLPTEGRTTVAQPTGLPHAAPGRMDALRALFEWIDAQPPVPHLPLAVLDRDELY